MKLPSLKQAVGKSAFAVSQLLFPPVCPICSRPLWSETAPFCPKCAKSLPKPGERHDTGAYFDAVIAPFAYQDPLRTLILDLKFNGISELSEAFGIYLADAAVQSGARFDFVSWVPISTARLMTREYDQAQLIAASAAKQLNSELLATLYRTRNTRSNSSLNSAAGRERNVANAFEALDADIANKRILLVDDVITSGSTINECARVLKTAGAATVTAAAVCTTTIGAESRR